MPGTTQRKVIVGLSGGVDSAVAAARLLDEGYHVEALFMTNWQEDDDAYCTAARDLQDARRVCQQLGIALHRADFSADYRERVFSYFLEEYAAGRTPNPDVLCNREIKFGVFFDYALRLGADYVATGHYARVRRDAGRYRLLRGADPDKDQSYFLHAIDPGVLDRVLFPLGEMVKGEVRELAFQLGLHNHARKDSTGICFIGERPFREFLANYLPAQPGPMETPDGQTVGEHQGLMYYTLGQRQGLGLGGVRGAAAQPWYVVGKNMAANALIVAQGHNHPLLFSDTLAVSATSWLCPPPGERFDCSARTRYRQADRPCNVALQDGDRARVEFRIPQRAVTPGQYAVFYTGEVCLGGGIIAATASSTRSARAALQ